MLAHVLAAAWSIQLAADGPGKAAKHDSYVQALVTPVQGQDEASDYAQLWPLGHLGDESVHENSLSFQINLRK